MKIGIDYRLAANTGRGMGKYTKEIVKKILEEDKINEYILYTDNEKNIEKLEKLEKLEIVILNSKNYFIFEQILLSSQAKKDKLDILWCPYNTFPLFLDKKIKLFVTIHDLIYLKKFKKEKMKIYNLVGKYYRKYNFLFGKKRIDKCFTVSNYVKKELEKYNINNPVVTYNKIDISWLKKEKNQNFILEKLKLRRNEYFFTVSGITPNKNLGTLIEVFLNNKIDKKLVICGVKNWEKTEYFKKIKKYNKEKRIIFTNFLEEKELKQLYINAYYFIFLSIEEGFGIPLIESLSLKTPVIASRSSCIPEIVGKNAILVNPLDKKEIYRVINQTKKNRREEIVDQEHLNLFIGWENTAKIILENFNIEKSKRR